MVTLPAAPVQTPPASSTRKRPAVRSRSRCWTPAAWPNRSARPWPPACPDLLTGAAHPTPAGRRTPERQDRFAGELSTLVDGAHRALGVQAGIGRRTGRLSRPGQPVDASARCGGRWPLSRAQQTEHVAAGHHLGAIGCLEPVHGVDQVRGDGVAAHVRPAPDLVVRQSRRDQLDDPDLGGG
jgi:hypothetical protein